MQRRAFGTLASGEVVDSWTLRAGSGLVATVLTYGARIHAIDVPTPDGPRRVTLGRQTLAEYVSDTAYLGAVIGRVCNRIDRGRFALDGRDIALSVNQGGNTLHGGKIGFDQAVWRAEPEGDALLLRHTSPDGDQGFPGALHATVRYALDADGLAIDYTATAEAPSVVNLTNHAYFNLDGAPDVLGHVVTLQADRFLPVDAGLIPTGELRDVAGTAFDFRAPHAIGERIGADHPQLRLAGGYDHCFVLADRARHEPAPAARVQAGGIALEVLTTEPGLQFYSGNFLPESGLPLRAALCLETQHFPDAPNHPAFPSIVLRPGQTWRSRTVYRFMAG